MPEVRYTVVRSGDDEALAEEVNRLMEVGYVPVGGVAVTGEGFLAEFYQAMVKPVEGGRGGCSG